MATESSEQEPLLTVTNNPNNVKIANLDKQNDFQEYDDKLKSLRRKLSQIENDESPEAQIEAMSIHMQLATMDSTIFELFNDVMKESERSYNFYREMLTSNEFSDFRERIKSAMEIHQRQWKLLTKTSRALQSAINSIPKIKDAIEDIEDQLKSITTESEDESKEESKDQSHETDERYKIIDDSIKTMTSWMNEPDLKVLAIRWGKLIKDAQNEELEWCTCKRSYEKRSKKWPWEATFLSIGALCLIGGTVAICILCPPLIPVVIAGYTLDVVACGAGIAGIGAGLWGIKSYFRAKKKKHVCREVVKVMDKICSEMSQTAQSKLQIDTLIKELDANLEENKKNKNYLKQVTKQAPKNKKWNRVERELKIINDGLIEFDKKCRKTIKIIRETKYKIAGLELEEDDTIDCS